MDHIRESELTGQDGKRAQTLIATMEGSVQILAKRVQKSNCDGRPSGHRS